MSAQEYGDCKGFPAAKSDESSVQLAWNSAVNESESILWIRRIESFNSIKPLALIPVFRLISFRGGVDGGSALASGHGLDEFLIES